MSELIINEYQGQRVLTTQQLAQAYECNAINIQQNFNNHQDRFAEGKDFYKLEGAELKAFKGLLDNVEEPSIKFAPSLIIWTSRGANRHSKILDTDRAWQQFDLLEETYFQIKSGQSKLPAMTPAQLIAAVAQQAADQEQKLLVLESRTEQVESRLTLVKDTIIQRDDNWRESINAMVNKIVKSTADKDYQAVRSESYQILEERGRCDLSTRLRNLKQRLSDSGATKSKVSATTKMDVIESEPRLKEIYTTIIKEMTIKYVV